MHVELNYLLKTLWPLHSLCFLVSSGSLCMLISMLQDNSKCTLLSVGRSMCSNFDPAYRFLYLLVGISDHTFDKMLHQTKLIRGCLNHAGRRVLNVLFHALSCTYTHVVQVFFFSKMYLLICCIHRCP